MEIPSIPAGFSVVFEYWINSNANISELKLKFINVDLCNILTYLKDKIFIFYCNLWIGIYEIIW
jgi:hypothetical protein